MVGRLCRTLLFPHATQGHLSHVIDWQTRKQSRLGISTYEHGREFFSGCLFVCQSDWVSHYFELMNNDTRLGVCECTDELHRRSTSQSHCTQDCDVTNRLLGPSASKEKISNCWAVLTLPYFYLLAHIRPS